jgi:hypothetical protein
MTEWMTLESPAWVRLRMEIQATAVIRPPNLLTAFRNGTRRGTRYE